MTAADSPQDVNPTASSDDVPNDAPTQADEAPSEPEATDAPEPAAETETEVSPADEPSAEPTPSLAQVAAKADDDADDGAEPASDDTGSDDDDDDTANEASSGPETRRTSGYERGEIVEVVIQEVSPTSVIVMLDERGEGFAGVIPARELDRMTPEMIAELQPGNLVSLFVVNPGNNRSEVVLSYNRALEELDWKQADEYRKSREIYEGVIAGYNKGGLIVRFGRLRGFVPQSQIGDERRARLEGEEPESRWSDMVREPITVKVIEVDRERNRLILSERAAARETREARKARLIEELTLHEVRTGRVVSLEDFGAFVDIGGAEGLVHVTELSWGHVTHPKQVVEIGQELTVEVISIDPDRKRIGLSLKRQLTDPWDVIATNYQQGQLVKGEVTKLTKFGAFAQLVDEPDVEGLIHISELSENRVSHPREVVNVGEVLTLRIVKIDVADRRLGLSLKRVNSTEYLDSDMNYLFD